MIIHKIVAFLKTFFEYLGVPDQMKKKNKGITPQPLDNLKGKSSNKSWLNFFNKKRHVFQILSRGGSHLSRVERRRIFLLSMTKVFATLILVVLLLFAIHKPLKEMVTSIQIFQIKDISVSGCLMTDQVEVKKLANLDYSTSIFEVMVDDVVHTLVQHPWIKIAKVKKQWPNSITIEILEHNASAMIVRGPEDEGKFYYLDRMGVIIAAVQVGQNIDFPVITGANDLSVEKKEDALKDAIAFLKEISRNDPNLPAQSVSEIHLDKDDGMVIHLVEFPFPIYFGRGEVKKKYKQLRKVLAVLYKKRNRNTDISEVEYIRVDYLENKVLIARTESG